MSSCGECGQELVCPKCTSVIEQTDTIVIRCKDTSYNGGYPNLLIIVPVYNNHPHGFISVATIIGDNFWKQQHTYHGNCGVTDLAQAISGWEMETWFKRFNIPRTPQMRKAVKHLMEQVQEWSDTYVEMS